MNFHFDIPAFVDTLPMVLFGMLGIFAVILVIWVFVAILNKATSKAK
jgi:hypothetical protein